jgi:hypothetical protein
MNFNRVLEVQIPQRTKDVASSKLNLLQLPFDPDLAKLLDPVLQAL